MTSDRVSQVPTPAVPFRYARSWLLVPAVDSAAFESGLASAADVVILDLEDGVAVGDKPHARSLVTERLRAGCDRAWIRINDADSAHWADDLTQLGHLPGLEGVILAKTEHGEQIEATAARLPRELPIVALIESAAGLEAAADIAKRAATSRLAFGSGDFRRDTGMANDPLAMSYPRGRLTVASRAAGLPGPVDGPTLASDPAVLTTETSIAAASGMTGRLCLRAAQTDIVNRLLSPSAADIEWAESVLERQAANEGKDSDGSYLPQLGRAEKLMELARIYA
ncbi:HpcH/HpaI aldolase/citrate lyase family protein [Nocardia testacea]|uniref:HpcH/HpaI aldolase/citrate lyase family protein n=1 Tax=Nocardia testacea TaxID=248551 RepID=UPI00340C7F9A